MSDVLQPRSHDLDAWLDTLRLIDPNHIELGTERVRQVAEKLGVLTGPWRCVIEVAGTNGKGSTAALIAGVLNAHGCKTGLYTSPHLLRVTERIQTGGIEISGADLAAALDSVEAARGGVSLTYFEYLTLAALWHFKQAQVQFLVLEVGLGGRLDAVNVLDADIAVITSIGLDHTQILGDTEALIAGEKAGIIKKGAQVVAGLMSPEAAMVIARRCTECQARLFQEGLDFRISREEKGSGLFWYQEFTAGGDESLGFIMPEPRLPLCVAGVVLKTLQLLREGFQPLTQGKVQQVFRSAVLPGRMHKPEGFPGVLLDVAHNPPAVRHLLDEIGPKAGRRRALVGMLADKDIETVMRLISGRFEFCYLATLGGVRGAPAQRLQEALRACGTADNTMAVYDTVAAALDAAFSAGGDWDRLVCFGSFITVSEALRYFAEHEPK